jgi:hypothetical protein
VSEGGDHLFSVSGIAVISKDEIVERQSQSGVWFNFVVIAKDPYREIRHYYKISMHVPIEYIDLARDAIQVGKFIQIRHGELAGRRLDSGTIFMTVSTKWKWIESIKALPGPDRKQYQDV